MDRNFISRREMLRAAAVLGAAGAAGLESVTQVVAASVTLRTPPMSQNDITAVDEALGKKGRYVEAEAVYTVPLPRNDLKVTIKGEAVPIPLGFGGWVSFKKTTDGKSAVVMSDTVLLEEEVNPLISAAHANGLEVSAIHNHFFYESPRIFYMHLHGMGQTADLARRYAAAIKNTKLFPANQPPTPTANAAAQTGNSATPAANASAARTGKEIFDLPALDRIVGHTGTVNGPTYKYTIGRDDLKITAMGAEMTANIGLNTWAAFAGERDAAHIAGDVAMLEPEVNPVIRALRRNNLEVVALHHHMLGESPRIIFLHYYGHGSATVLAQGFRAALGELGKGKHETKMNHAAM
ncbi:MAG: DUF1259 domain-containing protein [Acidobacteriota bacterium]|nr:DUF1259 domain-containing protein [Acidobacteriota bacterium]